MAMKELLNAAGDVLLMAGEGLGTEVAQGDVARQISQGFPGAQQRLFESVINAAVNTTRVPKADFRLVGMNIDINFDRVDFQEEENHGDATTKG